MRKRISPRSVCNLVAHAQSAYRMTKKGAFLPVFANKDSIIMLLIR